MRRRPSPADNLLSFGGNVPPAVGGLIIALLAGSILGTISPGVRASAALVPAAVFGLQVWRLVTWVFVETDPLSLVFGGLMLYWFGRDLSWAWGPQRFLATWFGLTAAAAVVTTLLALFIPGLSMGGWLGAWPVLSALVIAWATIFPERQILLMFALPISGRTLLWITLGGTLLYAMFGGIARYIPHIVAQGLMLLTLRGNMPFRGVWQTFKVREMERRAKKRASHLKVVKKDSRNGSGSSDYLN
jgi:membrane associated rhomboid family serine protease